jgi:hypothetical protein
MKNKFTKIILIAGLILFTGSAYAIPPVKVADEPMESTFAPKKKKAGEECKSSDECQRHHQCSAVGDKSVCTRPPRAEIPKT